MLTLIFPYLPAHVHAVTKEVQEVVVNDIDPGTKGLDSVAVALVLGGAFPYCKAFQEGLEVTRGKLLLGVRKGAVRVAGTIL